MQLPLRRIFRKLQHSRYSSFVSQATQLPNEFLGPHRRHDNRNIQYFPRLRKPQLEPVHSRVEQNYHR